MVLGEEDHTDVATYKPLFREDSVSEHGWGIIENAKFK